MCEVPNSMNRIEDPEPDQSNGQVEQYVRPTILIRVVAWFRRGNVVWLQSNDGESYQTIAKINVFGELECPVYWLTNVGRCILLENGKISNKSKSIYIVKWKLA